MASTCRTATAADAADIVALVNEAYLIEAELLSGDRIELPEVQERLERGSFLVCDAESGGLAGCVYVEVRGKSGYLGLVSVAPSRQSGGLGGALMRAAEGWLREAGCGVCELWVLSARPELSAWYGRLGYRVVRTESFDAVRPPPNRQLLRPCHFEVMEREL